MKVLFLGLLLSATSVWATNLDMNPGLWSIKMDINHKGKAVNFNAEMEKAMKSMSAEQKAQMKAMMKSAMGGAETQACYTKEMLNPKSFMNNQEQENCKPTIIKNTSTEVQASFKCNNGATGTAKWTITDKSSFEGIVDMTSNKGEKSKISYTGKFINADCGDLKPAK